MKALKEFCITFTFSFHYLCIWIIKTNRILNPCNNIYNQWTKEQRSTKVFHKKY